jgi:hypothetical protein
LPFLYLDCGTEDPFLPTNRELKLILEQRKIPHEYRELPGTHEWAYWDRQIRDVLQMAEQRMNRVGSYVAQSSVSFREAGTYSSPVLAASRQAKA